MSFDSPFIQLEIALILLTALMLVNILFKNKKKSPESIYKLIDDLEKKYIQ